MTTVTQKANPVLSPDLQNYIEFVKLLKPHKPIEKKIIKYFEGHSFDIRKASEFSPLRAPSYEVPKSWFGTEILSFLEESMEQVMENAGGVGLAAIQIGIPLNMFIAKIDGKTQAFYNPIVHNMTDPYDAVEGCLSLDNQYPVIRYKQVFMSYSDKMGESEASVFTNLVAEIIQHEIDHLTGILID